MAITYTRTTITPVTNFTATAAVGGSLTASTQYWFVIIPLTAQYQYTASMAIGAPSSIVTATTTVTDKTINLAWTAVAGALGYNIFWTTTDPGTNAENFNATGWCIKDNASTYYSSVGVVTAFSFTTLQTTGAPNYSVPYTDAYRFNQVYNQKTDYLLMSNVTEDVTMEKIYQACVTNVWDSISRFEESAYDVKANLYVTTNGAVTDFRSISVQTIGGFYANTSNSMLKMGYNSETGYEEGTNWTSLAGQAACSRSFFEVHDARWHGISLKNIRKGYKGAVGARYLTINIYGDDWQFSDCNISTIQYFAFQGGAIAGSFIKNMTIQNGRWSYNFSTDTSLATVDNIMSINSYMCSYVRRTVKAKGLKAYGSYYTPSTGQVCEIIAINSSVGDETHAELTDSNIPFANPYVIQWYNSGRLTSGLEYIRNLQTQTFHITDVNNSNITNASVTIQDKNGVSYSGTTNSGGVCSMVPIIGVHNAVVGTTATNYGVYTNLNPFTMTVSKTNYQTLSKTITLDGVTDHNLALISKLPSTKLIATEIGRGIYVAK